MKVSKNSWHFTLNRYFYGYWYVEQAKSLCPYFWGTILAIIILPIRLTIDGIMLAIHHAPEMWRRKWHFSKNKWRIWGIGLYGGLAIFDAVILHNWYLALFQVAMGVFFTLNIIKMISDWRFGRILRNPEKLKKFLEPKPEKPRKDRKPNMLWEMLKALKNKHCPILEWSE